MVSNPFHQEVLNSNQSYILNKNGHPHHNIVVFKKYVILLTTEEEFMKLRKLELILIQSKIQMIKIAWFQIKNPTVKTLVAISEALGGEIKIKLVAK